VQWSPAAHCALDSGATITSARGGEGSSMMHGPIHRIPSPRTALYYAIIAGKLHYDYAGSHITTYL
jgi:hypothetical protein